MIGRDYYSLEVAAETLNYSVDDLIYLGSKDEIQIGVLIGNRISLKHVIDGTGCLIEESHGFIPPSVIKLAPYCLVDYEANPEKTEVVLQIYFGDGQGKNSVVIKILDNVTEQPLLMKDAKLVIFNEDLQRLQDTEPTQINKPLTESERNKYLKQIGVMALLLAETKKNYKLGDKPNASNIDKAVQDIFDAGKEQGKFEFLGQKGTGSTELRNSIGAGLKLLQDDD
ncbi:MAG: hypothetical protein ACXW1W_09335 [Methylococcaceae bacterium]